MKSAINTPITVGSKVYYCNDKNKTAIVRYLGGPQFSSGIWVGLELPEPYGRNDGSVLGKRYFKCKPNYGMFVRASACSVVTNTKPIVTDFGQSPISASLVVEKEAANNENATEIDSPKIQMQSLRPLSRTKSAVSVSPNTNTRSPTKLVSSPLKVKAQLVNSNKREIVQQKEKLVNTQVDSIQINKTTIENESVETQIKKASINIFLFDFVYTYITIEHETNLRISRLWNQVHFKKRLTKL